MDDTLAHENLVPQEIDVIPPSNPPVLRDLPQLAHAGCRRRNPVHDAIVEAALKIERTLGTDWALALLRAERVPDEVGARIAAQGPRQVRARKAAPQGL